MAKYIYETEYEIPDYCGYTEDKLDRWVSHSCPFFSFHGISNSEYQNCECALVPWTGNKRTPKFTVEDGKKWERCPLSRKRAIDE